MDISINWTDDTHQCVQIVYGMYWTWDEFFKIDDTARAMLDSIDHKADFILDLRDAILPKNVVGQFPRFARGAASLTHPNSRLVVLVGTNPHLRTLLGVFQKVYAVASRRIFLVDSADDARLLLAEKTVVNPS
jgi:hypothetical protein